MDKYYFKTSEFGISDTGFHLLRSGFNYKTINFSEVSRAKITRGKELNNWFIIFLIGVVILLFGVYLTIRVIDIVINSIVTPRIAILLFISFTGGFFVYTSFQAGIILKLEYGNKNFKFPLKEIVKEKGLKDFKLLLSDKLNSKLEMFQKIPIFSPTS